MINVHYALPFINMNESWVNVAFFKPEPLIKLLISERNKDVLYLKCPSFQEYYKNCYVIKCPFDLTLTVEYVNGQKTLRTHEYGQDFFDNFIHTRFSDSTVHTMLTVNVADTFFSDESVTVELLPPFMHKTEVNNNVNVIVGAFDISKWVRPVEWAVEMIDDTKPLKLKRGDPLYYVRFVTKDKINLIKEVDNEQIFKVSNACVTLKKYIPNKGLNYLYETASPYISAFKLKFFKQSKCPFSFLRIRK